MGKTFPNETPILVQYTPIGENAEHYESIVKSPSHMDEGKLESVPALPPHNKTHLIHVCRLVRCLNSPLRSKKKGLKKTIRPLETLRYIDQQKALETLQYIDQRKPLQTR